MTESGQNPLLSIIVPSFRQGRYLRDCIESVLTQDYRPVEIIVVDGGSKDETVDVLRSYAHLSELRWISEPDKGPADAVNKGLKMARGELTSIQSADDWYLPGAFSRAVREFQADPAVGLVYGEVHGVNESGERLSTSYRPPHDNALCIALCVCIPQCSAFFRTALGQELGGWRGEYHTCDWEFWLRMMFRTRTRKVDEVLSAWRMYEGQRTDQRRKVYDSFNRMLDESPDIRSGGFRVQQGARAARHLISVGFGPRTRWSRPHHILMATLLFPAVWPYIPRKAAMFPGFNRVSSLLRSLKGVRT